MKLINRTSRRNRWPRTGWFDTFTIDLTWDEVMHDLDLDWIASREQVLDKQGTTS